MAMVKKIPLPSLIDRLPETLRGYRKTGTQPHMWSQFSRPIHYLTGPFFFLRLLTIFFSARFIIERFNESQLIEAERCHLQRESLVRHLYDSEEDYLRSLQEIQSCYQQPLLHNLQHPDTAKKTLLGAAGAGKSVATKEEIETLFGNLDQLIAFHEDIRTMLEDRSKIWGPTQIMSDLLLHVVCVPLSPAPLFISSCHFRSEQMFDDIFEVNLEVFLLLLLSFSFVVMFRSQNNRFQGSRSIVRTLRTFMRLSLFWTESQGHPNIKSSWR